MIATLLAPLALAAVVAAQDPIKAPEDAGGPPGVYFGSVSYGGNGCPQGTVSALFAPDRSSFTLLFDSYVASAGPGVPITEGRKACQIAADIRVPQGWQYSIVNVDYRGYVALPPGGVAQQSSIYYFQGSQQQSQAGTTFNGPIAQDYLASDAVPISSTVWSQCNAQIPFNIKSQVRLFVPPGASGQITTDSIDAKVKQIYGLSWRQC
jgi:hypothetical protein